MSIAGDDRVGTAGNGCRQRDVVIGIGEEYRNECGGDEGSIPLPTMIQRSPGGSS